MENTDNSNLEELQNEESELDIFTEENIEKIKHINDLLKKQEDCTLLFAQKLHATLKHSLEQKDICDYNFDTNLQVYSVDEACNKRNKTEEGNPMYEESISLFCSRNLDANDMFYSDNWNLYCKGNHPLANIPFCYSMHCITSHSHLTWQDILDIGYVWIDLQVDYQFMVCFVDDYFEDNETKTDS